MKIQFLGTGAAEGVPALFCTCTHCAYARAHGGQEYRSRAGSLIDGVLKIDFGPDAFKQMLDNRIDYTSMRSLLVTHAHEDHFVLSEINCRRHGFAQIPDGDAPLVVYGNGRVGELMAGCECDRLAFQQMIPFQTVMIEGYAVTPLEAVHCVDERSGRFPVAFEGRTVYRSEEALIYLIQKDDESLLYAHDTDEFTPADMEFLAGRHLDMISMDCTNASIDADYIGHMGVKDNLRMRDKLLANGAADGHTVLVANHFSHNGLVSYAEMCALLPGFVVATDGMTRAVRGR